MWYTRINAYEKGLVFSRGKYMRMLDEGFHLLGLGEKVELYDMQKQFLPPVSFNILLQDDALADALQLVEVKDNEIAIRFDNGLFATVLTPGRYAYWKGVTDYNFITIDLEQLEVPADFDRALLSRAAVQAYVRSFSIEPHQKALLYIDGKFDKVLEPGLYQYWKNQTSIQLLRADMRRQQLEINGQEILTKDKATLRINFFVQYTITDIMKAMNDNKEYEKQLHIIMQMALRQYVGAYTLDELLDKRNEMAGQVLQAIAEKSIALGLQVDECGIRDIILPGDVRDIMNKVMIAEKQAQANTIMRREETASIRSLLNTAKLMEENQVLMRLKEMEYVERIADKISNISISGAGDVIGQLKQVFVPAGK